MVVVFLHFLNYLIQLNSFYRFKFLQKYYFKYMATKHFFFASIYFWIRCLCSKTNSLTKIFLFLTRLKLRKESLRNMSLRFLINFVSEFTVKRKFLLFQLYFQFSWWENIETQQTRKFSKECFDRKIFFKEFFFFAN